MCCLFLCGRSNMDLRTKQAFEIYVTFTQACKMQHIYLYRHSPHRPPSFQVRAFVALSKLSSLALHQYLISGVVFLDIRKAFDLVDHSILLEKVQFYRVADRELMWFKSYLTARKQRLINGCLSSQSNLLCGVPQGSILALFFSLST